MCIFALTILGASVARQELNKLNLQKLSEELFYAVPHKQPEVKELISDALDVYWTQRRYGESLKGVQAPPEYFTKSEKGTDMEANSKRVYKQLVFDLVGELMVDIYQDEDEEEEEYAAWMKPKPIRKQYFKGRTTPTMLSELRPLVENELLQSLGLVGKTKKKRIAKWAGKKKKDHVDRILVQELRTEETEWVNYDADELSVKMQLSDAIFDSLLKETGSVIKSIAERKAKRQES